MKNKVLQIEFSPDEDRTDEQKMMLHLAVMHPDIVDMLQVNESERLDIPADIWRVIEESFMSIHVVTGIPMSLARRKFELAAIANPDSESERPATIDTYNLLVDIRERLSDLTSEERNLIQRPSEAFIPKEIDQDKVLGYLKEQVRLLDESGNKGLGVFDRVTCIEDLIWEEIQVTHFLDSNRLKQDKWRNILAVIAFLIILGGFIAIKNTVEVEMESTKKTKVSPEKDETSRVPSTLEKQSLLSASRSLELLAGKAKEARRLALGNNEMLVTLAGGAPETLYSQEKGDLFESVEKYKYRIQDLSSKFRSGKNLEVFPKTIRMTVDAGEVELRSMIHWVKGNTHEGIVVFPEYDMSSSFFFEKERLVGNMRWMGGLAFFQIPFNGGKPKFMLYELGVNIEIDSQFAIEAPSDEEARGDIVEVLPAMIIELFYSAKIVVKRKNPTMNKSMIAVAKNVEEIHDVDSIYDKDRRKKVIEFCKGKAVEKASEILFYEPKELSKSESSQREPFFAISLQGGVEMEKEILTNEFQKLMEGLQHTQTLLKTDGVFKPSNRYIYYEVLRGCREKLPMEFKTMRLFPPAIAGRGPDFWSDFSHITIDQARGSYFRLMVVNAPELDEPVQILVCDLKDTNYQAYYYDKNAGKAVRRSYTIGKASIPVKDDHLVGTVVMNVLGALKKKK
jgi:hypothetical protein